MVAFRCSGCNHKLNIPDEKGGLWLRCPLCREKQQAPVAMNQDAEVLVSPEFFEATLRPDHAAVIVVWTVVAWCIGPLGAIPAWFAMADANKDLKAMSEGRMETRNRGIVQAARTAAQAAFAIWCIGLVLVTFAAFIELVH